MALKHIVEFVRQEVGLSYNTAAEQYYLNSRINSAAEEIWINNDLPDALKEQYIYFNAASSEIFSLPPYVGQIRGARRPQIDRENAIRVTGPVRRYQQGTWGSVSIDCIRILSDAPTARDIEQEQPWAIMVNCAQSTDTTIVLQGNTAEVNNKVETVVIPRGELCVTYNSPYTELLSAAKDTYSECVITAMEESLPGEPLFQIQADQEIAAYKRVQIVDRQMFDYTASGGFEFLFKERYKKMYTANHEFMIPRIFDRAIAFWTIAQYCKVSAEIADKFRNQALILLVNRNQDEERGRLSTISWGNSEIPRTYDRLCNLT